MGGSGGVAEVNGGVVQVEDGPGSLAHGAVALNDMLPEDIRKKVQDLAGPVDYFSEEVGVYIYVLVGL